MKLAKKTRPIFFRATERYYVNARLSAYAARKDGKVIQWKRSEK